MSRDKSEIIVLCEGSADAVFVRRFLKLRGYDKRKVRVRPYPAGKGCGEKFVRDNFPTELKEHRQWQSRGLIVLIDGDGKTVAERQKKLDADCLAAGVPVRTAKEAVIIGVPSLNIESWFVYLEGGTWSEVNDYAKRKEDALAKASAEKLHEFCYKKQKLPSPPPSSLEAICCEWKQRF